MNQKNKEFLGWIALDIDGTITLDRFSVPEPVVQFLQDLVQKGWRIAIATGRTYSFAMMALEKFHFPYLLIVQNGTLALEMPAKKCLFKRYLVKKDLREIELAYAGISGDFVVYSGYENHDRIYWRPSRLDVEQTAYIQQIEEGGSGSLIAIQALVEIQESRFPLVKGFGSAREMKRIAKRLTRFNTTLIRDLYTENTSLLLVTDRSASKGLALEASIQLLGPRGTVIAAGDDENDASLLQAADIKIAMAHAPVSLQSLAHVIAPPTSEHGIIHALQLALKKNG